MTSNVRMILDEVNARIKLAEAKTAEDPSNFDSFPGAENDQAVPAETKKPDPEVKDEGPASRTEVDGAKPGSDAPVQQDHLYEADEPLLTPEKKPADSADAEAKVASANPDVEKVAADILSVIKEAINKQASAAAPVAKKPVEVKKAEEAPKTEETKEPVKQAEETTPVVEEKEAKCGGTKKDAKCCGAAAGTAKIEKKEECCSKKASETISLGKRILDKIASIRSEKQAAEKQASVDKVKNLIKAAAEYKRGKADAEALIQKLAQALEDTANSSEAAEGGGECGGACEGGACETSPEAAGAADAEAAIADAAAADAGAAGGDDQVTPEEVAQAVNELVDEGQISSEDAAALVSQLGGDADPAEGGEAAPEVTEDQIAEGIAEAIDSGAITEDEAQQLVQELVDAGADESVKDEVASAPAADAAAATADAGAAEEAAGAADAEAAIADAQKEAEALQKKAEDEQIARYQKGFVQKCAEYGADPQKVAQYIQARISGK